MALPPGTLLGVYRVGALIGAGGMGEVYRARDERLERDVALKILPDLFASDPDRLSRFEREARTLAALNHPNIAHIYGLEHAGGVHALVMELVEGEDLAQRIARGPLPLDDVLAVAGQTVDALEAAHEQGIIHRDLKPANMKMRADGAVKVLDFGLAKALEPSGPGAVGTRGDAQNSPTFTSPAMTQVGVILGTAAYMAPEQARGKAADRRSDIWAFGCVLYEMLTGRRPFAGDDVSLTLAAVLKEPVDLDALPPGTPPALRRLLRHCLEKDPRKRLSSIADARLDLRDAVDEGATGGTPAAATVSAAPARRWRTRLIWAAAGALAASAAFGAFAASQRRVETRSLIRSDIRFPGAALNTDDRAFAIAPDGSALVISAGTPDGPWQLYRRRLSDDVLTPIPGTEEAMGPFFSPDGRWLGYVQRGRVKRIPAAGGPATDLAEASGYDGASFTPDGGIVFNPAHGLGLLRIRGGSTAPETLTTVDPAAGEAGHHWPQALPDGKHVLFTAEVDGKPYSEARIMLVSLDTGKIRRLIEGGTDARYVPTGHIVYWRLGALVSVPFDLRTLEVGSSPAPVLDGVMLTESSGSAHFDIAGDGTLVYASGRDSQGERGLVLVDRSGAARPLTTERKAFHTARLSPDGSRVATTVLAANDSLWTVDTGTGSATRITFEAENSRAVWSDDGTRLAFTRYTGGQPRQLHIAPADGGGEPQSLRAATVPELPDSWSGAAKLLAFTQMAQATGADIWVMSLEGERQARPWLATRFDESQAQISPDGRWIAYTSTESGRSEVYVRSATGAAGKRQVSFNGGAEPRWRSSGREIFFRREGEVLVSDVSGSDSTLGFSPPRVLFKTQPKYQFTGGARALATWDVFPDGNRFVFIEDYAQPISGVHLVQNWFSTLKR